MSEKKCPACGAPMEANKCTYCGHTIQTNQQVNNQQVYRESTYVNVNKKSKLVLFLLCLFFGYFGVHRFYVGKVGSGIVWLFTGGMFGIGWFIDLIMILLGTFKDKNGQPIK